MNVNLKLNGQRKLFCTIALGTALFLAVTCPCEQYLSCKKPYYLGALAVAAAFAVLAPSKPEVPTVM